MICTERGRLDRTLQAGRLRSFKTQLMRNMRLQDKS
jgi:hypothetical protein